MPDRIYAATGDDVVRIMLDGASIADVHTVLAQAGATCVAVDPRDSARVYAGTFDRGLFASEDGGTSWRPAETGLDDRRVLALAVSRAQERFGVGAVYAGTEPSNLYRSDDGGVSWQRLPALRMLPSEPRWSFPGRPWTHHVKTIALHPSNPDRLLVGIELGGVMRSRDGGASWLDHNPEAHSDAHQLLTHPGVPDRVYEVAGQGVAVSEDRGETWHRQEQGLDRRYAWAAAIDPEDPDLWYVSVSRSPFAAHGGGDGDARLFRRGGNGHADDGVWVRIDSWGDDPPLRRMPYSLATLPGSSGRLLVGLRGGTLMLTDDAGATWTRQRARLADVVDLVAAGG